MLSTYDDFTLNSIFRPKTFGRNIELRVKLSYVLKAFGRNIELRVKLSSVFHKESKCT